MTGKTHIVGGALAVILYSELASQSAFGLTPLTGQEMFGVVPVALLGSLMPDIDLCSSKVGNAVKPLSVIINKIFGHRSICHSLTLLFAICFSILHFFPNYRVYIWAYAAGVLSHLMLDMLNAPGVELLWPVHTRFRIAKIKTESFDGKGMRNKQEPVFRTVLSVITCLTLVGIMIENQILPI